MIQKNLVDLLTSRGIHLQDTRVYLMRHADKRHPDLIRFIGTRALTLYQAVQSRPHETGGLIVGFFGNRAGCGLLLGVWRIGSCIETSQAKQKGLLQGSFETAEQLGPYFHELIETDVLQDLRLKLEIEWGREMAWRRVLKMNDAYPVFLRQGCPVSFPGISSVSLVMSELRIVLSDIQWKERLGSVGGVYLITDELSGRHYIGSACGGMGILQRWSDYARTGHGENKELISLMRGKAGRENDFRFTLLETFAVGTARNVALARENFWKVAVGSRIHRLNCN